MTIVKSRSTKTPPKNADSTGGSTFLQNGRAEIEHIGRDGCNHERARNDARFSRQQSSDTKGRSVADCPVATSSAVRTARIEREIFIAGIAALLC